MAASKAGRVAGSAHSAKSAGAYPTRRSFMGRAYWGV